MAAPAGSILPTTFFDGLSQLWGACAYVGSAIVAAGFVFAAVSTGNDPIGQLRLLVRLFLIGLATLFLREWLMRLNDVVSTLGDFMGIDPVKVDDKFVTFISGTSSKPGTSVWDVIWGTGSIGTAMSYALLWLFGWLSWAVQYIVKLVGDVLLSAGWALSPIFLSFFMIRPMAGVGLKYLLGLIALVCWPFGWVMAAVVTNALLDAAAKASLIPVVLTAGAPVAPVLTVLLVGVWMIMSSLLSPYVTTRVLLMGANPAAAFAQGVGGASQAAFAGGVGAAVTAATGGAAAAGVVAAAVAGAASSGVESSARGGGAAATSSTAMRGLSGFYGAGYSRRQTAAAEGVAASFSRMAGAAESMASSRAQQAEFFREAWRRRNRPEPERAEQPHTSDPNKTAIEIEVYAKK